jgi:uncharacterized protein
LTATVLKARAVSLEEKLRRVPAGLDHAVRQAEERRLDRLFIVDADCHQEEPFSMFLQFLDERWRRIVDKEDLTYDREADPFLSYKDEGAGKISRDEAEAARYLSGRIKRPEVVNPMTPDMLLQTFSQRMRDIGIARTVVLPTYMLSLGFDPRPDFEAAMAKAYISYMVEHILGKREEVHTMIYAPANAPREAAELIERFGSVKGVAGIMVTSGRTSVADASWDPIFEAAEKKGLPICFHANSYFGGPFGGFDKMICIHSLSFPFYLFVQLTGIVMNGVPERFPKLKFCFMEGGVSWIPWIMHRLDSEYIMRRSEAPLLKGRPSEYINDFYYTTQPLERPAKVEDQERVFNMFDSENHLMYASDYPHWDFDVPSVVYDLPFLSMKAKKKILGENARGFFRIS